MPRFKSITEYYNHAAEYYDDAIDEFKVNTQAIFEFVNRYFHDELSGRLLDVCCGTGDASRQFARQGMKIYGVDNSPGMLEVFKQKNFSVDSRLVDVMENDLPYQNQFFDIAISNGAFCIIPSLDKIISEAGRVLKSRGIFCFSAENINRPSPAMFTRSNMQIYRHSAEYLEKLLEKSGFNLIDRLNFIYQVSVFDGSITIFTAVLCRKN